MLIPNLNTGYNVSALGLCEWDILYCKCSCLDLIWEDVSDQVLSQNILITLFVSSVSSGSFEETTEFFGMIWRPTFGKQTSHIPAFVLNCAGPRSWAAVFQINLFPCVAFPVSGGDMETWRPGCSLKLMNSWASPSPQIFMSSNL